MNSVAVGVFSLTLLTGAVMAGAAAIGLADPLYALAYLAVAALLVGTVIAAFCTKCPLKGKGCLHILPGRLAALLPARQGKYTAVEIAAVLVALLLIAAVPQYWLLSQVPLLALFWLLAGTGVFLINRRVCPVCGNRCCPLRPKE
ncbi:hypothetical protein HL657_11260 [Methanoculleus sp. YWC-01]|uniref:Methylamine utilization protein MauE n=1 Tax=Methanoculleus nereidis TaxID=2735141 RepID=A0ABU3Z4I4_9EURY|nr:hypothetical protein [Methanoculleus sp. YWC-01]MDV4343733.1 hypothetical protein [Methanoculleus sp. YWC-01]